MMMCHDFRRDCIHCLSCLVLAMNSAQCSVSFLHVAGSPSEYLFLLIEGQLKVMCSDAEVAAGGGDEDDNSIEDEEDGICVAIIDAPTVVGEVGILYQCAHTATVQATAG